MLSCRVSFCHERYHAELCIQLLRLSQPAAWLSLWRRMNQRRNCCPHPTPTLGRPFLAHVHLAAPGLSSRWRCHSTCLQVEAASSWDRANTPAGRAGPGQDSCGLVPCLHKHTAAAGVSSLPAGWLCQPSLILDMARKHLLLSSYTSSWGCLSDSMQHECHHRPK